MDENALTPAEKGINLEQMDICRSHLEKWERESWAKAHAYMEDVNLILNQIDGILSKE